MVDSLLLSSGTIVKDSLDTMSQIGLNTYNTAENTRFGIVAGITFFLAIATFIVALLTYRSQKATENNTAKLGKPGQRAVLQDMIRHLYRNLVVIHAIREKMKESKFLSYPLESHIIKLKLYVEDIHQSYYMDLDNAKILAVMAKIRSLNNYNTDLSVFYKQISDQTVPNNLKEVFFEDIITRTFLMILFVSELMELILVTPPKFFMKIRIKKEKSYMERKSGEYIKEAIKLAQKKKRDNNEVMPDDFNLESLKEYLTNDKYFKEDIEKEKGNKSGIPCITMIPFS